MKILKPNINLFAIGIALMFMTVTAQSNLDYYLNIGYENSPLLKDFNNQKSINQLQNDLNSAQNSAFNVYISADYLFAPYFNNNGKFISTNPSSAAIGYDAGITNGGLYSAQINVEKNIFNGALLDAYASQTSIKNDEDQFNYELEKHKLKKAITDQYLTAYQAYLDYNLSKEIIDNLKRQLNITSELAKKGYEKARNFLLLKVEMQNQNVNLSEVYQKYKSEILQLNSLCGIKDTQFVKIDSVSLSLTNSKNELHFNRKFYLDSLSLNAQQSVFETKYLPQLKLFANTGLNAVEIDGIQKKFGFSAGLNFSLPLFDGGQKSITQQQNEIAKETIGNYKNYSSNNLKLQRDNSLAKINSLRKNIDELNTQIKDYKQLLKISLEQLERGGISMIDYLTMLRNFIDIRKIKIEKEISYQIEINNYNYWNW